MPDEQCTTIHDVKTCLTRGESIGAVLNAEAGLISLSFLCVLFLLIIRNVYRNSKRPFDEQRSLVQEPADILMLSLFTADLLQAIGAAMNVRWASFGYVETGRFCTAQGSIQQLGETAVAMTTLSIALQTFVAVCFRKFVHSRKMALVVVGFIWLYVALFVAIGAGVNGGTKYFVPTPFWCWVGDRYPKERIFGEYLWLWLTLFVSILVYIPLFLWGNGYISVGKDRWWEIRLHLRSRSSSEEEGSRDRPAALSLAILGYPVVYSILILPLSICRWRSFSDPSGTSPAATYAVVFIFGFTGAANVTLLLCTRPNLLLFDSEPISRSSEEADAELGRDQSGNGRTRGRTARRRLHEKGRMVTPSRSSSRHSQLYDTSNDYEDDLGTGGMSFNSGLFPGGKKEGVRDSESVAASRS